VRTGAALAVLLFSIPLFGPSASQAARSSDSVGARCVIHRASGVSSAVCDYSFGQPFVLAGYSRGGQSTLSYAVQCGNDQSWPRNTAAIDRTPWGKRSFSVRGNFKIYGSRTTLSASKHCDATRGQAALLHVTLKMSKRVTKTNLVVKLDVGLPWAGDRSKGSHGDTLRRR